MEIKSNSVEDVINLMKLLSQKGNIYIAGAGKNGKVLGELLTKYRIKWDGYIDKPELFMSM